MFLFFFFSLVSLPFGCLLLGGLLSFEQDLCVQVSVHTSIMTKHNTLQEKLSAGSLNVVTCMRWSALSPDIKTAPLGLLFSTLKIFSQTRGWGGGGGCPHLNINFSLVTLLRSHTTHPQKGFTLASQTQYLADIHQVNQQAQCSPHAVAIQF